MEWQAELDELHRRQAMAREMGGADSVAFHHGRGKLTVRERIAALEDPGTFREVGSIAGAPSWSVDGTLDDLQPTPVVMGTLRIDGRKVTVAGGGPAGQAGAIRHGITRALVEYNEELRPKLKAAGFLTRDPRKKERKKYGQKGARARYQFSKR